MYYPRTEMRLLLIDEMKQPNSIFEILQKLQPAQRDMLKWVCERGGKVSMQALREHSVYDDNTLCNALHPFEEHALAFDTVTVQGRVIFVPIDTFESIKNATA